jgi:hypothetical protein
MGDPDTLRLLMPVAATLAALLVAGVAALCHLAWQPAPPGDTWQVRVRRLASQSPWQWRDLGWILLLVAIAQAIRIVLPNHLIWDQAAFQGVRAWRQFIYSVAAESDRDGVVPAPNSH